MTQALKIRIVIPAPGQKFVHNSPNAWAPLAYDAELDIVYVPTGVGTPDIYGGHRTELHERYAKLDAGPECDDW